MPDSPTTRLGLYKSLSDGSEDVNYTQDIGQNLDKLDAAAGFQVVTSGTRPSSPYSGKGIAESDTTYRSYFSNGTAPASASWVQIPNSSSTFNADLDLTSGKQVNVGGSGSTAAYAALLSSATGDFVLSSRVTADSVSRIAVRADGRIELSSGSATADTILARSGTAALSLTGSLAVSTTLTVTGTASAQVETTTSGAVASTDFTVTSFAGRKTCGIATVVVTLTYSGATITGSAAGNITDTACVTLPAGYRPAAEIPVTYDKSGTAQGSVSIATSGLCTLKTLDATATIASGNTLTFAATFVL